MSRMQRVGLAALVGLCCSSVQAGVYQELFRGLQVVATPSGFPLFSSGDGTRVNGARSGRLRIVPSGIGPGYELQMDRRFGADSTGRPEIFYLGGYGQLQLNGAMQWTAGYNGKKFRTVRSDFGLTNMAYELSTNIGVQDAVLSGVLNADNFVRINPLGFYTIELDVANTNSNLELDGVVIRDDEELDFDIGPIAVEGNFFVDGFLGLLTGLGVDTSAIEGYDPRSPIDRINDEITRSLQAAAAPKLDDSQREVAPLLLSSIFEQDENAANALISGLVEDSVQNSAPAPTRDGEAAAIQQIPEPTTLALLILGSGLLLRRPRS